MQWTSRQAGLLTSCSVSADGRLVVCAADPQNGVNISDAASGQTLHHVNGTTARQDDYLCRRQSVREGAFVLSLRSPPLHHHTVPVRPSEPACCHSVCRPQHQTVGPARPQNHRVHRQVTDTLSIIYLLLYRLFLLPF